jgi:hypothetical protein
MVKVCLKIHICPIIRYEGSSRNVNFQTEQQLIYQSYSTGENVSLVQGSEITDR